LETWEDKTSGQKRSRMKVIVESLQFLGGKSPQSADNSGNSRHHSEVDTGEGEDCPF